MELAERREQTMQVVALIHEENGVYGASFPDFPGCTTAATDPDTVIAKAAEVLARHIEDMVAEGLELPQVRALANCAKTKAREVRCGCLPTSESIVDAEFADGDSLLDINSRDYFRHPSERPRKCQRACAKIVEIVLEFGRPVVPKRPFETAADRPTRSCLTSFEMFREYGYIRGVLVASPRRAPLGV